MLIDWFTVVAQALNFVILVWLMKRFLYRPVLRAIDAREQRIDARIAEAETKNAAAQKQRDEFQERTQKFDLERDALLATAQDEVKAERQRLLDLARQAADALGARRKTALRNEAKTLQQAIRRKTQAEVFSIARKALTEMAGTGLEERLAAAFTQRLRDLDGKSKASLTAALKSSVDPALVRSAFELPAAQRTTIQETLNEACSADLPLRFEAAPDLISGIEVSANGQKLAWSLAGYIDSLATGVDELLEQLEQVQGPPEAEGGDDALKPAVRVEPGPAIKAAAPRDVRRP